MFEKMAMVANSQMEAEYSELRDIILNDPAFAAFVAENNGSYKDALSSLKAYAEGSEALSRQIEAFSTIILNINNLPNKTLFLSSLTQSSVIDEVNLINGYVSSAEINNKTNLNKAEKTEKILPSMIENVHEFLERNDYSDIQTNKASIMLLHLAHLGEQLMSKLAVIEVSAAIEKGNNDLTAEQTNMDNANSKTQQFFDDLEDPELLSYIVLEEYAYKEKMEEIQAEKQKIQDEIQKYRDADEIDKDELVKNLFASQKDKISAGYRGIAEENEKKKQHAIQSEVREYEAVLRKKNEENQASNTEAQNKYNTDEAFNQGIDQKINEIKSVLKSSTDSFNEKKETIEKLRSERSKTFASLTNDYLQNKKDLSNKAEYLKTVQRLLAENDEIEKYAADPNHVPPNAHTEKVIGLLNEYESISSVEEKMFHFSDNERNAEKANLALSSKYVEAINNLRTNLKEALEKQNKLEGKVKKNPADEALKKDLEAAKQDVERLDGKVKKYKDIADVQDAVASLWKKYPQLQKEYKKMAKNDKEFTPHKAMISLCDNLLKSINSEKAKYKEYYDKMDVYKSNQIRLKDFSRKLPEIADGDPKDIARELEAINIGLGRIEPPDKNAFDKETEILCSNILDLDAAAANLDKLKRSSQESIDKLEQSKRAVAELKLEKVLTEKEIASELTEKEALFTQNFEALYSKRTEIAQDEYIRNIKNTVLKNHISELKKDLSAVNDKEYNIRKARSKIKTLYEDAIIKFDSKDEIRANCGKVSKMQVRLGETIENQLRSLHDNLMKGKDKDHPDTHEFQEMQRGLREAYEYVRDNKAGINKLNEETLAGLNTKLDAMDALAKTYNRLKQKGIHWIPSNMRFIRLAKCQSIQDAAGSAKDLVEYAKKNYKLQTEIGEKANSFSPMDPGKDLKSFAHKHAKPEVYKSMEEKYFSKSGPAVMW